MPTLPLVVHVAKAAGRLQAVAVGLGASPAGHEARPGSSPRSETARWASPEGAVVGRIPFDVAIDASERLDAEPATGGPRPRPVNRLRMVPALLGGGRPAAVLRRVRPVVVDAVDGRALGLRPHVREEVHEALRPEPSIADRDASAAVARPVGALGVRAAADDATPGRVLPAGLLAGRWRMPVDATRQAQSAGPFSPFRRTRRGSQRGDLHGHPPVQEQSISGALNANL